MCIYYSELKLSFPFCGFLGDLQCIRRVVQFKVLGPLFLQNSDLNLKSSSACASMYFSTLSKACIFCCKIAICRPLTSKVNQPILTRHASCPGLIRSASSDHLHMLTVLARHVNSGLGKQSTNILQLLFKGWFTLATEAESESEESSNLG